MTLPGMVPEKDVVGMVPFDALNHLVGMFFWWDSAARAKRRVYHGQVMGSLEGGYYLIAFDRSDEMPTGLHEVVHVSTMVEDNWSFYRERVEMCAEIVGKENVD